MKLADQIHAIMEENDNLTDEQLGQAVDSFLQIHTCLLYTSRCV